MPAEYFRPGDPCWLQAIMRNPGPALQGIPLVVLLDIGVGRYWFWPSWSEYPPDIDYQSMYVPVGRTEVEIIPEFAWPEGAGEAEGIVFYGAMLNQTMTGLLGDVGMWTFGFGP
jgi:hypothetical protein